jgi:hypothetical protein
MEKRSGIEGEYRRYLPAIRMVGAQKDSRTDITLFRTQIAGGGEGSLQV